MRQAPSSLKGIGFCLLALALFSCLDTTAKHLTQTLPVLQVTAFRYLVALLITILLINPRKLGTVYPSKRPFFQVGRSILLLGSTAINFYALQYLQLDQTLAILFTTPFFVAIMAGPILGEWIGKWRWMAIGVGFIGVLIITQPWQTNFHWAMGLSFIGALFYASYSITTKIINKYDSNETTALHSTLWAALILVACTAHLWVMPHAFQQWAELCLLGFCGAVGHWFMIKALRLVPASTLSPFIYLQMPVMITCGYIVFDQTPALNTLIGSGIIIVCGLYMLYRERVRGVALPHEKI